MLVFFCILKNARKEEFLYRNFVSFYLTDHIPKDSFYRVLKDTLDPAFVRRKTQFCYAFKMGRSSLDPIVFFKCDHRLPRKHMFG